MVNRGNYLRGSSYQQVVRKTCVELTSERCRYHAAETEDIYQGQTGGLSR